jgi:4-hydroxy-2-oxoheptanedioate aldolase
VDIKMTLKERMKKGPVFGFAVFTGALCVIEAIGNWGYDFVYLDVEHTSLGVGPEIERQIMSAKLAGIPAVIRLTGTNEVDIPKGPRDGRGRRRHPSCSYQGRHRTGGEGCQVPPLGRRGAESNVRAAGFGGPGFNGLNTSERAMRRA